MTDVAPSRLAGVMDDGVARETGCLLDDRRTDGWTDLLVAMVRK